MSRLLMFTAGWLAIVVTSTASMAQEARVDLELIMARGFPPEDAQRWMRALENVGADGIRMRQARTGDATGVKNIGTESRPRYRVVGLLASDGKLTLPGGSFRMSDTGGIKDYLDTLKADGLEGVAAEKMAFGLTGRQLIDLHEDLSATVTFSTRDQPVAEVVSDITRRVRTPIVWDRTARTALRGDLRVKEELRGLTAGTVLANIIRPAGLVLMPRKERGKELELVLIDSRRAEEHWPIGWPAEESPSQLAPKLFESETVEIRDYELQLALDAIEDRVEIPFLYDQNSLARNEIDPSEVKVTVEGKMYYLRVIRRMLGQTRPQMKAELRLDEAGKPFLWISTTVRD